MGRTIDARWIKKALAAAGPVKSSALPGGGKIAESVHMSIWGELMRGTQRPSFPIDVAESMSIDDYDLLGLIGKTASTVSDALARVERYLPIWTDAYTCRVLDDNGALYVTLELDTPGSLGARCATESAVAELTKALRDVTGADLIPTEVTYRHRAPIDVSAHERFFRCAPRFAAAHDGVRLTREDAERPVLLADRALREFLTTQLDALYAQHVEDFGTRLRRAVREALGDGIPHATTLAEQFEMSTRTLHRRLADDGVTFGEIVEGEQLRLSRALLTDARLTLTDIAYRTGFSEPSAFSRAYRRWTGRSPSEDR